MTTAAEPAPAWLVAWRQGTKAPTPALVRPAPPPPPTPPAPPPALPAAAPRRLSSQYKRGTSYGFFEPKHWDDDGGIRREAVLDLDCNPPRVVRRVGWMKCLRCRRSFFSSDVIRRRLCRYCGHGDESID